MRPDSIYANGVVRKAVNCVYECGMNMQRRLEGFARERTWRGEGETDVRLLSTAELSEAGKPLSSLGAAELGAHAQFGRSSLTAGGD